MPTASLHEMPLWLQFRELGFSPADIIDYFGIKTAPVPVIRLANELGVRVVKSRSLGTDGELTFDLDADEYPVPVITTNATQHVNRRRFTVAHELGHLMMHDLRDHNRDTDDWAHDPIEAEANAFAANLLMPRSLIERYVGLGMLSVPQLAKHFRVSPIAMSIRLRSF